MSQEIAFPPTDVFVHRHLGSNDREIEEMLSALKLSSLEELITKTIPDGIRYRDALNLPPARSEYETLNYMKEVFSENEVYRSYIGMGYTDTITPPVIQRNILENPGWYTQYTPYQAEIAQGRLEALFNFQTMLCDLLGMEIANASMLDEATAAAEALSMAIRVNRKNKSRKFFVSETCHPQTIAVIKTRAKYLDIEIEVGDESYNFDQELAGALIQIPDTHGSVYSFEKLAETLHKNKAVLIVATDILYTTLTEAPGHIGADIVVGNTQRFGVPLGYGGPHAGFLAAKDAYRRQMPGRIIGQSLDADGNPALRLALQTREQHIRREKATSNICTAQVLLAVMASMYAVYHGSEGLKAIAERVHLMTVSLSKTLSKLGYLSENTVFFDTLTFDPGHHRDGILDAAEKGRINLRIYTDGRLGVTLDEAVTNADLVKLSTILSAGHDSLPISNNVESKLKKFNRTSEFLTADVFKKYRTETEFLRYVNRLQQKDLSLTTSMIPLGSCTMKLNATTEMLPVTWEKVSNLHPFAPLSQAKGYANMTAELESMLAEVTGMDATSLQPNAGSQGEYSGMLAISAYHESRDEGGRNVCLIPSSAHGTNPASAVMAGMKVVIVKCDERGNIDVGDLKQKAEKYAESLSAMMVTYPSTHGVFEESIVEICETVHKYGGQVYLDGANMNAQVGLARPGDYGADVCHLNLHKTFAIPHGGGGPGVGPICVKEHLAPYLPSHPVVDNGRNKVGPVAASPWGSASVLPISWAYILMMGAEGLKRASEMAILNANYMAIRLEKEYPVLYHGTVGMNAHEFILDMRGFKKTAHVEVTDIAKRLMDYGYHAPTVSFPVPGTLMIEPTESESKEELDRFCDALISIRKEIEKIENGDWPQDDNPLVNSPHTAGMIATDSWDHPYGRTDAVYPNAHVKENKFWPAVRRIDDAYGDRHLVCMCEPIESYSHE